MTIEFKKAKHKLSTVWFVFSAVLLSIMLVMSLNGKFGEKESEAWGWFLPTVLPTLSLILAIFLADINEKKPSAKKKN